MIHKQLILLIFSQTIVSTISDISYKIKFDSELLKRNTMQQKTVRVTILATLAIVIIGGIIFFARSKNNSKQADMAYINSVFPLAPTYGKKDAPNSIVLFEDLACPWCEELHNGNYKKLYNDYVKTGKAKVRIVAVQINDKQKATTAAYCLAQQKPEYFQQYTDYIYNKVLYTNFEKHPTEALVDFFMHPTEVLSNGKLTLKGLDLKKLNQCIQKPNMQKIGSSYTTIFDNFVRMYQWNNGSLGTPMLIVNGQLVNWADYEKIKQLIK
jgi:protein-disulfide isomerase